MSTQFKSVGYETPNGKPLFKNINLSISSSEKIGLVGPNGIGKTTFAKLLAGELNPTEGSIQSNGKIIYFPQQEDASNINVEDYLKHVWTNLDASDRHIVLQLIEGIPLTQNCLNLSGGEWTRLRLANAIAQDAALIIFDEPTNNLDRSARQYFYEFLIHYGKGLIIISHDREVLQYVDSILELSNQGLTAFGGNWDFYEHQSRDERNRLGTEIERTKRELNRADERRVELLDRQDKRMRKGQSDALKSGDPKIILGLRKRQAQKTLAKIDEKTRSSMESKLDLKKSAFDALKVSPKIYADFPDTSIPNSKMVFEANELNFRYAQESNTIWKRPINFIAMGPVKLALKGKNGAGKSTFLNLLLNPKMQNLKKEGNLKLGSLRYFYLDQNLSLIQERLSIIENVKEYSQKDETSLRNLLAQFLFQKDQVYQVASTLSGGERLRLALAMAMLADPSPQLLILDEPTNNIDVLNLEFIEALIRKFRGALIVVSHDQTFLTNLEIDHVLDLDELS